MSEIINGLFLGSADDANSAAFIRENGIVAILNVATEVNVVAHKDVTYKKIDCRDSHNQNISQHFDECFSFIDKHRRVLVNCMAGISRSATIVIAYLMSRYNMQWNRARLFVISKRPIVDPNINFIGQLVSYDMKLSQ